MQALGDILGFILKAVLGGIVDAVNSWRRDQALQDLGYTKAQRDQAVAGLEAARRAQSVQRLDRDAALARLRDGTF